MLSYFIREAFSSTISVECFKTTTTTKSPCAGVLVTSLTFQSDFCTFSSIKRGTWSIWSYLSTEFTS